MPTIIIGENAVVKRNLFLSDGTTELPLTSLSYLIVEVMQYDRIIAAYTFGVDSDIVAGDTTNQALIQIKESLSSLFNEGPVWIRLKMKKINAVYADGYQYDIDEWTPFSAEL